LTSSSWSPRRSREDATLESLQIDSLSAVEFMFLLEERFEVDTPAEATNLRTIQDVVSEIERLVAEKNGLPRSKAVV
jgi:acyl carrier protein